MQLKDMLPSLSTALIMAVPVYLLTYLPISYYITLPIQIIVGIVVTIALCEWRKQEEYLQLKGIVKEYAGKIRNKNKRK